MQPNSNSSIAALCTIQCRKGDTFSRDFAFTNADTGAAIDMTSYVLVLTVKNSAGAAVLTISGADWSGTASAGLFTATKSAATMAGVAAGTYAYDLQITLPTAEVVTWLQGKFVVDTDITTA
ncbi:MAG: hypothetical protein ACK5U7_06870 [Bacteroidota bacterium]|jgi:hypothetical protein